MQKRVHKLPSLGSVQVCVVIRHRLSFLWPRGHNRIVVVLSHEEYMQGAAWHAACGAAGCVEANLPTKHQLAKVRPDQPQLALGTSVRDSSQMETISGRREGARRGGRDWACMPTEEVYVDSVVRNAAMLLQELRDGGGERSIVVLVDLTYAVNTAHSTGVCRATEHHAIMFISDTDSNVRLGLAQTCSDGRAYGLDELGLVRDLGVRTQDE